MKRKVSKISKRRLMIFGVISVASIIYFFVTLFGYTYSYVSLKNEETSLKNNLITLQDKKANLKIEIQKLNDPEYVARYAKEKYLYSADGEYVLKLDSGEVINNVEPQKSKYLYLIIGCLVCIPCIFAIRKKTVQKN